LAKILQLTKYNFTSSPKGNLVHESQSFWEHFIPMVTVASTVPIVFAYRAIGVNWEEVNSKRSLTDLPQRQLTLQANRGKKPLIIARNTS
jgi:hypothetical protein